MRNRAPPACTHAVRLTKISHIAGETFRAPDGFASLPAAALDPPCRAASPMVSALRGFRVPVEIITRTVRKVVSGIGQVLSDQSENVPSQSPTTSWPEHDLAGGRCLRSGASGPRRRGVPRGAAALLLDRVRFSVGQGAAAGGVAISLQEEIPDEEAEWREVERSGQGDEWFRFRWKRCSG